MTFEVELKFRIRDPAVILRELAARGAVPRPAEQQIDCYLSHPSRDFAITNEALRVRTVGEASFLTYKGPVLDYATKTRREIEFPLSGEAGRGQFLELFTSLGFHPAITVTKLRRPFDLAWQGRRFLVAVDDVPRVGTFLELELIAEAEDLPAAQAAVRGLAAAFGLDAAEEKTYLELVQEAY